MNELVIGDKIYISSKRAAEITGYAKDYVGQLCREGHVEAKMVGRSWYVLETSIRAHRFGAPELNESAKPSPEEVKEDSAPVAELPPTWETPRYVAEIPPSMPIPPTKPVNEAPRSDLERDTTIIEMQSAWKEWFQNKQQPLLETPEIVEAREEEYEHEREEEAEVPVPVVVHKIPEAPPPPPVRREAAFVPVQPLQAPVAPYRPRRRRERTSAVTIAILVVVAGLAVAVGVVGSGFADKYMPDNGFARFLGGTSSINK